MRPVSLLDMSGGEAGFFAFMHMNFDRRDVVFFVGLLLLTAGAYLVYVPAVFLVPGGLLVFVALWGRG